MYEEGLRGMEFVQVHEDVWKTITLQDGALAVLVVDPLGISFYSFSLA
jgi:hypothetical protein